MTLASNRELYDYLLALRDKLIERGANDLGSRVEAASRHAAGMSTEFLGESRVALRSVYQECAGLLIPAEQDELVDVIQQIDLAFDRRR